MGQGRLVVIHATEPREMVVRHGENGLLLKAEDQLSLTEALARGVDDFEFRDKVGKQARSNVLAHHTWRENSVQVLEKVRDRCRSRSLTISAPVFLGIGA